MDSGVKQQSAKFPWSGMSLPDDPTVAYCRHVWVSRVFKVEDGFDVASDTVYGYCRFCGAPRCTSFSGERQCLLVWKHHEGHGFPARSHPSEQQE